MSGCGTPGRFPGCRTRSLSAGGSRSSHSVALRASAALVAPVSFQPS